MSSRSQSSTSTTFTREIDEQVPAGWVVIGRPVTMAKAARDLTVAARLAKWGVPAEIEDDDVDALRAKVPEGYALISVRRV